MQMRSVERATPASCVPVGGSVANVLGLDAVVLGDGGVSSVTVGRYVSVGDMSVSDGGDTVECCVDTVLSGAGGGGLGDVDRVSGGGDTEVCCVDNVLSGAVSGGLCDLARVSGGGDTVVCCVDTVLSGAVGGGLGDIDRVSGGGNTDVCGVDMVLSGAVGGVCVTLAGCQEVVTRMCVVLTRCCRLLPVGVCVTLAGCLEEVTRLCVVLTRCCRVLSVDVCVTVTGCHEVTKLWMLVTCQCLEEVCSTCVVVSGVDESVCGVNSVTTAGELDVFGGDTVVSGVHESVCGVNLKLYYDLEFYLTFRRQSRIATIGIWSFTLRGARARTVNLLLQEYHFYKSSICEKCIGATAERDVPYVTFMAKSRLLQKAYTRHCIVYLER